GGRQPQSLFCAHGGPNGRQIPSKFASGLEIADAPIFVCTTGSLTFAGADCGCSVSLSLGLTVPGTVVTAGRLETLGETPWKIPFFTCGPNVCPVEVTVPLWDDAVELPRAASPCARLAPALSWLEPPAMRAPPSAR